jgi:chorismate dehydratase
LDVALVSSIELFRKPGYSYIPNYCVGTRGAVSSVQVFLRKPLAEVQTLAMDPASRTSQALVQILLSDRAGGPPEYLFPELGQDPKALPADAWLSIGDTALQEYHRGEFEVFNPSQAWAERFGLPFVFAAWIVRADVAVESHAAAFARSFAHGQKQLGQLAAQAGQALNLPLDLCEHYLQVECAYSLGADMQAALKAFGQRAGALKLTDPEAVPIAMGV